MMKTPISASFQTRDKYASFHERRIAAIQINREVDSIRQRLPHGSKSAFEKTFTQMVKHLLTPPDSGKSVCTFDRKDRVQPGDELPVDTLRRLSIYDFISVAVSAGKHELAFSVAELAKYAPEKFPFEFSKLDAWRLVIDFMLGDDVYRRGFHVISRKEAREKNLPTFFTNEPCVNGNFARRRTSDGRCICRACLEWRAARDHDRRIRNPGKNAKACKESRNKKILAELNGGAA